MGYYTGKRGLIWLCSFGRPYIDITRKYHEKPSTERALGSVSDRVLGWFDNPNNYKLLTPVGDEQPYGFRPEEIDGQFGAPRDLGHGTPDLELLPLADEKRDYGLIKKP